MQSPFTAKEILNGDTPLFLFDCTLANGTSLRWSSQTITWSGNQYDGRVLRHNLFEAQAASDTQIGGGPRLSFELANADSLFSEIEQQTGFKGGQLIVRSLFANTITGAATTDPVVVFRGLMNPPDLITESTFRLSAMNRMAMQRSSIPEVSVQRLCPWRFPVNAAQRAEAVNGGAVKGKFSPFYRCGYSPDQESGTGNLNGGAPYTSCALTRTDCIQRGMFNRDGSGNTTGRYGGLEYVPATILVRGFGQKNYQLSAVQDNQAAYNDPVPLVYGTQWHMPDVVFSRNDGNLTHMEVLLSLGEIQGVQTVLVNDIVIPRGVNGMNMASTGWWNLMSAGTRNGVQDPDFGDGDPYGSMAYLSVVVPNRINDGTSIPAVQVLMQGMKIGTFDPGGNYLGEQFSSNPAWVLLDILRRSAYGLDEINTASFAAAAAYCDGTISYTDPIVGVVSIPRFECNFALKQTRSAGEIIRSLRNASRIYLVLNSNGLLEARIENTFALQQPLLPPFSNATTLFNGGWPAYEFNAGSIARNADGGANFRLSSKGAQDTPNRLSVTFQDQFNQFQQDSLALTDGDDADLCGQQISVTLDAMGISNFSQASRMLLLGLNRGIEGNRFIEFETSVKALGLMPGDLITVTYAKENLVRTPFRIVKITPGNAFRTAVIRAQFHNDAWYSDTVSGIVGGHGWQPGQGTGYPAPVGGSVIDSNGIPQLSITEAEPGDVELTVSFTEPGSQIGTVPAPLISLVASVTSTGGTLAGNSTWFYALSAVDSSGGESPLSFVVQASTSGGGTNSVTLSGIGLAPGTAWFHVYRGAFPTQLYRIASSVPPSTTFIDTGFPLQTILPPDPQFDHVNLYWRWELVPEAAVTVHSSTTVGNGTLAMMADRYVGSIARITGGTGSGQERRVIGNTATVVTVDSAWAIEPDSSSFFAIAENSWRQGNSGKSSPLTIDVPERLGSGVQISPLAANADNQEAPFELSPLTRWVLGSSGALSSVPPAPSFALTVTPGAIDLAGIGFSSFVNTGGIVAGTYTFHYFDELKSTAIALSAPVGATDTSIHFGSAITSGTLVQIGSEIVVAGTTASGVTAVTRAVHGTTAAAYLITVPAYPLTDKVVIVPFIREFFGSPASGDWNYSVELPGVRLASAELYMTNSLGDGPVTINPYTATIDGGLRTLAGGQYTFQITGYLALQTGAAPNIIVDNAVSIRDIYAVLRGPSTGAGVTLEINRNGAPYAAVSFDPGATTSHVVDGFPLPPLAAGDQLSLDVTGVGTTTPGNDLTLVIRL